MTPLLGEAVRRERKARNLTQRELGELAGTGERGGVRIR
jgi:transcriptional regulator with XRE-family HTH domain